MRDGYDFYIDGMRLPIAPPSLTISNGSNNEVVNLINDGDINIIKSPALIEVSFEARFPMRDYPYAKNVKSFETYFNKIKELKEQKKSFQFIVSRYNPRGQVTWDTNLTMALETFDIKEDAEQGDDVLIEFKLKQWKSYGTKTAKITIDNKVEKTTTATRETKKVESQTYKIKNGDTLIGIARRFYNDDSQWKKIYNANKAAIEEDAKKHGKASSSNGHWIWAGLTLNIPA